MSDLIMEDLRYPVGKFSRSEIFSKEERIEFIKTLETFPKELRTISTGMSEEKLDQKYRPGGWTARQVIHHVADSHMNIFIRFKLALTESVPTVKPYKEELWAELMDTKTGSIESSLKILEGLHERWILLIRSMHEKDFEKTFFHPESKKEISLNEAIALYAWHSKHHAAHVQIVANTDV